MNLDSTSQFSKVAVCAFVAVFSIASVETPAQGSVSDSVLKGLQTTFVIVTSSDIASGAPDLNRDSVKADVEQRLRKAGLRVVPSSQAQSTLLVSVQTLADGPQYFYVVDIELDEGVILKRDPGTSATATTWSMASHGRLPHSQLLQPIRDSIDTFANQFLAANPR